ncbi:MAG: hypothetical protein IPP33_02765 [Flavobacteriales bacterium]|nr:hypothetical protein [Flavobacteriales bacterium]
MMRSFLAIGVVIALIGCGTGNPKGATTDVAESTVTGPLWKLVDLPGLDDNVKHDTLLIQTTFDLGDGTFIMVASNKEETREGIRLCLYRPSADSSAEMIAFSKPGYDSETMLPSFFSTGKKEDGWILLANMGERESWGQEAFWLKDQKFHSLGFLDVAQRDWKTSDDSTFQWRTNIGPRAIVNGMNGKFTISFSGDSLQLYDDLQGHREVVIRASSLRYQCSEGKAALVINGIAIVANGPV